MHIALSEVNNKNALRIKKYVLTCAQMYASCIAMEPEQIFDLRKSLGMNQGEFAREIGLDQSTVSRMERGVTKPNGAVIRMLEIIARRKKPKRSAA